MRGETGQLSARGRGWNDLEGVRVVRGVEVVREIRGAGRQGGRRREGKMDRDRNGVGMSTLRIAERSFSHAGGERFSKTIGYDRQSNGIIC